MHLKHTKGIIRTKHKKKNIFLFEKNEKNIYKISDFIFEAKNDGLFLWQRKISFQTLKK